MPAERGSSSPSLAESRKAFSPPTDCSILFLRFGQTYTGAPHRPVKGKITASDSKCEPRRGRAWSPGTPRALDDGAGGAPPCPGAHGGFAGVLSLPPVHAVETLGLCDWSPGPGVPGSRAGSSHTSSSLGRLRKNRLVWVPVQPSSSSPAVGGIRGGSVHFSECPVSATYISFPDPLGVVGGETSLLAPGPLVRTGREPPCAKSPCCGPAPALQPRGCTHNTPDSPTCR